MITVRLRHLPFRMQFDPHNDVFDVIREKLSEGERITAYYAGGLVVTTTFYDDGTSEIEFNRPVEIDFQAGQIRLIEDEGAL